MDNQLTQPVIQPKSFITIKVGHNFYHVSEREKLLCDTYMRSQNWSECARVFQAKYKKDIAIGTIKRWFNQRQHIKDYLYEQINATAEANITKDQYVAKIRKLAENDIEVKKTTPFFWKLLGEAKGFLDKDSGNSFQNNIQINILDGNGEG